MFSWRFILLKELIEEAKKTPSSSSSKSTLRVTLLRSSRRARSQLQTFANDARTQKAVIDRRKDDGW